MEPFKRKNHIMLQSSLFVSEQCSCGVCVCVWLQCNNAFRLWKCILFPKWAHENENAAKILNSFLPLFRVVFLMMHDLYGKTEFNVPFLLYFFLHFWIKYFLNCSCGPTISIRVFILRVSNMFKTWINERIKIAASLQTCHRILIWYTITVYICVIKKHNSNLKVKVFLCVWRREK